MAERKKKAPQRKKKEVSPKKPGPKEEKALKVLDKKTKILTKEKKRAFRDILLEKHNFDPIEKMIKLHNDQEWVYNKILNVWRVRFSHGRDLAEIFLAPEVDMLDRALNNMFKMQSRFFDFSHPKLKTVEHRGDQKPVTWNIQMINSKPKNESDSDIIDLIPYVNIKVPDDNTATKYIQEGTEENDS